MVGWDERGGEEEWQGKGGKACFTSACEFASADRRFSRDSAQGETFPPSSWLWLGWFPGTGEAQASMKRTYTAMDAPTTSTKLTQRTLPDGTPLLRLPQKRFYRQRAHANVFNDHQLN